MSVIDSTNPGGGRSSGDHKIWMGTSVPYGASPKASQSRKARRSRARRRGAQVRCADRPSPSLVPFDRGLGCHHSVLMSDRGASSAPFRTVRLPCVDAERLGITPGHWAHGKRRRTAIPRSDTHLATHVSPASSEQRSWNTSGRPVTVNQRGTVSQAVDWRPCDVS